MPSEAEKTESSAINARLEAAKASQSQIRFTLGMMAVISMMMLIASYNAYYSYDYHWIIDETNCQTAYESAIPPIEINAEPRHPAENPLTPYSSSPSPSLSHSEEMAKTLREQALKDWATSRIVLISLLGIRVSVDDAPILGTSVLLILSVWLLLWTREENHTIGSLLLDTAKEGSNDKPSKRRPDSYSNQQRWLIFHTINSNSIFLMVYPSFYRVSSLKGTLPKASTGFKGWVNHVGFGFFRSFFLLFPFIASFVVFLIDRRSYLIPDPFDDYFMCPGIDKPFFWGSMLVFLLCWALLGICCLSSKRYSRDTERILREYEAELDAHHSTPDQLSQS